MSQTLYEEAIAEARRLTEMAEQNAKNKIIDAVTPQIRKLIEQELMGAEDEMDPEEIGDDEEGAAGAGDDDVIDLDKMLAGAAGTSAEIPDPEQLDSEDMDASAPEIATPSPDDVPETSSAPAAKASKVSSGKAGGPTSLKMSDGEVEIKVGDVKIEIETEGEVELEESASASLRRIMSGSPAARKRLRDRLVVLERKVATLRRALSEARTMGTPEQKKRLANIFESLAREAVTLRKHIILTESNTGGRTLESRLVNTIIKEMKNMSRISNKNVFDFLFEGEEGETESTEAADVDVSAAGDALKALGDALGLDVEVGGGEEEEASEESEDEGGDEVGGDEDVELDLGESDLEEVYAEVDEMDEMKGMDEADEKDEADDMDEADEKEEGKTYELDEAALRRELRRLRSMNEGDAVSAASSFGGGKAGDEMFVDVDEKTLLNALADELGDAPRPKIGGAGLKEVATLRRQVNDYRNVASQLKKQLVEMNLFNAKLLYANKLMQNRDLSAKQQRAIVEALDNAKTLREAKLLYKSLTESLNKNVNKGNLAEGRNLRTLGSSSKSARSAQPSGLISEAGGTDRWALLAGIKKD